MLDEKEESFEETYRKFGPSDHSFGVLPFVTFAVTILIVLIIAAVDILSR